MERDYPASRPHNVRYKILPIGDGGVGKTSLLLRYIKIGRFEVEKKIIELQIWDTAGQERFRSVSGSMYKGMDAIIIVFDLTDEESFRNAPIWMEEIDRYVDSSDTVSRLLIGNKSDLDNRRVISREAAEGMAKRHEMEYVEVSAKSGDGVKAMFEALPTKIEAEKNRIANKAAIREDYTTNVVSMARNTSERECCNIC